MGHNFQFQLKPMGTILILNIQKTMNSKAYGNDFEIIAEDIDQARNIIAAFSTAIDKSKPVIPDFGNLAEITRFYYEKHL